jgi:rhodanese-related sulfurtransferase
VIDNTTSQNSYEIVRAAAEAYVAGDKAPTISAQALFDTLNDGDASNDPIIISVRSETQYNLGHIPGAINIPWRDIAVLAELKVIPPDRELVVYCYTGHTGAVATTALNMMGYDAKNQKYGMCSWTQDPDIRGTSPFSEDTSSDFAFNTGPNP